MPNSQFFDIFLFAVVAGVILFRLYTVLGRRTGNERPPPDSFRLTGRTPADAAAKDNVVPLPVAARQAPPADAPSDPVSRGLMDIKLADRSFETDPFISGARSAYELIVTAFAKGERAQLTPLLSDEVFAAFGQVISGREQRKESMAFTFVGFKDVKIVHAALKGRSAEITLAFGAQFISATTGQNASVIEGDSKTVRDVTDVWTFARDVRSRDPNWLLVATSGDLP